MKSPRTVLRIGSLIVASIATALIWMYRMRGGWAIDPICWMSLLWFMTYFLAVDLLRFRGRFRLGTLAVTLTCLVLLIGYPFQVIRMANMRAQIWNGIERQPPRAEWRRLWYWHRLPTGDVFPDCLAWRLPWRGLEPVRIADITALTVQPIPELISKEIYRIEAVGGAWRFSNKNFKGNLLAARNVEDLQFSLNERNGAINSAGVEVELPDKLNLKTFSNKRIDLSDRSWHSVFQSKNLTSLHIEMANVADGHFAELTEFKHLIQLVIGKCDQLSNSAVNELVNKSPNLEYLVVNVDRIELGICNEIEKHQALHEVRILGDINHRFAFRWFSSAMNTSRRPVLIVLKSLDLTNLDQPTVQFLLHQRVNIHVENCIIDDLMLAIVLDKTNPTSNIGSAGYVVDTDRVLALKERLHGALSKNKSKTRRSAYEILETPSGTLTTPRYINPPDVNLLLERINHDFPNRRTIELQTIFYNRNVYLEAP